MTMNNMNGSSMLNMHWKNYTICTRMEVRVNMKRKYVFIKFDMSRNVYFTTRCKANITFMTRTIA